MTTIYLCGTRADVPGWWQSDQIDPTWNHLTYDTSRPSEWLTRPAQWSHRTNGRWALRVCRRASGWSLPVINHCRLLECRRTHDSNGPNSFSWVKGVVRRQSQRTEEVNRSDLPQLNATKLITLSCKISNYTCSFDGHNVTAEGA